MGKKCAMGKQLRNDHHYFSLQRFPCLSIHGIEGAFYGPGSKTVIPKKVIGKFSIRLVPNQEPEAIGKLVKDYLTEEFAKLNSPNKFNLVMASGGRPWMADPKDPNFIAGRKAMKQGEWKTFIGYCLFTNELWLLLLCAVYGVEPDLTREGGSIPVTLTFQEATGKNVMLMPMGAADDGAHSQNEKIDKRNYIEGTKVMAAYLYELAKL